jgi:hypothetical protein
MTMPLKQSTAVTVKIGPFLDSTDGVTPETLLTILRADVRLSKNGGAYAQKTEASASSHDENGEYDVNLDATDTGALGLLKLTIQEAGATPVWEWFVVLTANVYDSLIAGSDRLDATVNVGYVGGAVSIDTSLANTNTVSYVDGTRDNPVSTIAAATTIAVALKLKKFHLFPGSSITLAQAYDDYVFDACHAIIALGGQSLNNSVFLGAMITGNDDGSNANHVQFFDCFFGSSTLGQFVFTRSYISGTITLAQTGDYYMHQCFSAVAGTGAPGLDYGAALAVSNVNMRDFSGGIEIQNMGNTGADTLSLEGRGQLILNANCNPANSPVIAVRGNIAPLTDNVVGGFVAGGGTISQAARYSQNQVLDAITDDATQIDGSQLNTHTAITPTSAGSGAVTWTYDVTDGSDPIPGVGVWVSTDLAGSNVIAGTLTTDANGRVTFFLDAGTYYFWSQKSGFNFTNPDTEVVA